MNAMPSGRAGETFRLPSELAGDVPRAVRLTSGGVALVAVALTIAAGALASAVLLSVAYTRAEEQRTVHEREGVAARAEVVHVALSRGEHPRRTVTYRYDVDGRAHTGHVVMRERAAGDIGPGATLPIGYLRSQPEVSWATGHEPGQGLPPWAIPMISAVLLVIAAAILWTVRRQWVLLSEGRVARARVTAHKKVHRDKHRAYSVSYEFEGLSGARHTAKYEVTKNPPPIGTLVPVVYHRDNPRWNAVYPLQLVRPVRKAETGRRIHR